jgi:ribonucleoside-diphosphate reductase alpha chain
VYATGEQFLHDGDVCNLGSINLEKFVTAEGKIDFAKLRGVVCVATRMLDNVIDLSAFPVDRVNKTFRDNRRIGLGIFGFADMLYQMKVAYNSAAGRDVARQVMKFITAESRQMSEELAEKKGVFPNFEKSWWAERGRKQRNVATTTCAPTGTIGMMFNVSGGVEPYFSLAYYYKGILGGNVQLSYVNKWLKKALIDADCFSEEILAEIIKRGSLQKVAGIPVEVKRVFVTSMDCTAEAHTLMQAAFQEYTDNAISKVAVGLSFFACSLVVSLQCICLFPLGCVFSGVAVFI